MNESLRRALLRARLTEEDVAAHLEVDPKTVRRWLEGRVPYPRHRWLLATTLGLDEADLWPQLAASRSWPSEIQAIYPHREDIPRETWLHLFRHAQERIEILSSSECSPVTNPEVMAVLAERAAAGVKERICLGDSDVRGPGPDTPCEYTWDTIARCCKLRDVGDVEVRVHSRPLNCSVYRADDQCLVSPNAYGIADPRAPVIRLRHAREGDICESYLECLEAIWASAATVTVRPPRTSP